MSKQVRRVGSPYPYAFLAPVLAVFTLFFVLPAVLGLGLSFTDANVNRAGSEWVGLANYQRLFGPDGKAFFGSIGNQVLFAIISTAGKTVLGVAIAFLLDRAFIGRNVLRALVYLPIMFSTIVVGVLFTFLLKGDGPVNGLLSAVGLGFLTRDWLGDFDAALPTVAAVDVWMGTGWTVVLVLAALQSVPTDVVEAARIDGASAPQVAAYIKIPFILHAVNLAMLLTFITGMQAFDLIYATTGGGPGTATEVMGTFIARQLSGGALGFPAAASFVQFALIAIVALLFRRVTRSREAALS